MDRQIAAGVARTIRPFAVQTTRGNVTRVIAQVQQRVQRTVRDDKNVADATAVAARWTTARHKLLTPESSNPVTSVTTLDVNLGPINEHLIQATTKSKATPGADKCCSGVAYLQSNLSKQQI